MQCKEEFKKKKKSCDMIFQFGEMTLQFFDFCGFCPLITFKNGGLERSSLFYLPFSLLFLRYV